MTLRCLTRLAMVALAVAMVPALAQTAAPAASAPASAPLASKPGPRLQTPTELRDSASTPGDLRPEERVTPQVVIPLRKPNPVSPPKAVKGAPRQGAAASSAGIDDSAARCEAEQSKPTRDKCLASIAPKGVQR